MISIYFGVAGSGKSLLQVHEVVSELAQRNRNVVTNCALNLGRLQAYLDEHYPKHKIDVASRVRILTREETKTFWRIRGPGYWRVNHDYDWVDNHGENGVLYIIDEAGASGFDARGWLDEITSHEGRVAKRGTEAVWYLDQHRKLGDDVVASANGRHPTTIAKPFRDKAEQFVRLRNGYKTRYGPFRAKQAFTASYYYSDPDTKSEPFQTKDFRLDVKGMASLYDTASGMGIQGTKADTERKMAGIPFWVLWPAAAALVALAFAGPLGLASFFKGKKHKEPTPIAAEKLPRGNEERPNPVTMDVLPVAMGYISGPDGDRVAIRGEHGWHAVIMHVGTKVQIDDGRLVLLR